MVEFAPSLVIIVKFKTEKRNVSIFSEAVSSDCTARQC